MSRSAGGPPARRPPSWAWDAIGRELLIQLQPFGVRLAGMGRRPRSEMDAAVVALLDEYRPLSEFHSTLAATGLLVVCLPLTAGTRGIIRAAEFQALRPGAILVNVGRGPLVDTMRWSRRFARAAWTEQAWMSSGRNPSIPPIGPG